MCLSPTGHPDLATSVIWRFSIVVLHILTGKAMLPVILTSFVLLFILLSRPPVSQSIQDPFILSGQCNEKCGKLLVPFPFYLNSSCPSVSSAFHLSCSNSSTLYLNIDSESYRVLEFFSDGVLVDFPGTSTCRPYNDLNSVSLTGNDYFGTSVDNVLGLYDCEDSSLCKADCETNDFPGCDGNAGGSPACCYPLSDHSAWHVGEKFSVFSKFGCRGFSSWVVPRGTNTGKRGVKLEWAIPRNSSKGACSSNADTVNATSVQEGIRCQCQDGYVGNGFASGVGCLKSCIKDGQEEYGSDCYAEKRNGKSVTILAGVLSPVFIIASLIALLCLLKEPVKAVTYDQDKACFHSTISFRKACRTRLFAYHELEEATKGFEDGQKLVATDTGTIYAGILGDGSHIAVHKIQYQDERELIQALSQIEVLSAVSHRNMARLLGCCIDCGHTPLVVYEYPANGTLEEHLHPNRVQKVALDWYKRLNIATETASVLAFLQYEFYPPIFHHDLKSSYLFLEEDMSAKIAGFRLGNACHSYGTNEGPSLRKGDVYDFGLLLLEMITGSKHKDLPAVALQKIKGGKLKEIVDPALYYQEQPPFRQEQIEIIADLGTRCLLFGGDGKIGMNEVARELEHISKESIDGGSRRVPALEETFSNSSLLQMISTSPDSVFVP